MLGRIKELLTTKSAQWYETLPFIVGFVFVIIEIVVRISRSRRPYFDVPSLAFMLSEGITVCIVPIYGFALAFDKALAVQIADKNSKVLAVAMFVAFGTLLVHILNGWFSRDEPHA